MKPFQQKQRRSVATATMNRYEAEPEAEHHDAHCYKRHPSPQIKASPTEVMATSNYFNLVAQNVS